MGGRPSPTIGRCGVCGGAFLRLTRPTTPGQRSSKRTILDLQRPSARLRGGPEPGVIGKLSYPNDGGRAVDRRTVPRAPRRTTPNGCSPSVSGGANPLWLTEWLAEALDLRPGMRVLDLGCGRAPSSIFLRREFGVQVWATDLWFSASENLQRIRDAGVEDGVFPIHADARSLPFAAEFFDAIVSHRLLHLLRHGRPVPELPRPVREAGRPGGHRRGRAHAGDRRLRAPTSCGEWWTAELWCLHSAAWWRRHWERTGIMDIELADTLPDGWRFWLDWLKVIAPENEAEIQALEADAGRHLGYVRVVGRRRAEAPTVGPDRVGAHPIRETAAAARRSGLRKNIIRDNSAECSKLLELRHSQRRRRTWRPSQFRLDSLPAPARFPAYRG